jgi:hypothetical protein
LAEPRSLAAPNDDIREMREILINSVLAVSLLACLQTASAGDPLHGMLTIDVMDPRSEVTQNINDRLLLRLKSEGDHEWEVQVIKRPSAEFPENLLYHSDQWHGPYPTQVFAWHVSSQYFPNERWLCVREHPYEVMVRLKDVETHGVGQDIYFVRGKIEVEWFQRQCKRGFGY